MKFEIVTIFPDFFRGPLDYGIVRRAREAGIIEIGIHDLRAFAHDRHKTVDDRPFGGGEGMVLKPEPLFECVESLGVAAQRERLDGQARESVIVLSAQGRLYQQPIAAGLAQLKRIVLICGRYEGMDERVTEHLADREICVGNFVMSGGELGAALIVDTVTRLLHGALGNEASSQHESFSALKAPVKFEERGRPEPDSTVSAAGLLDYVHYTRPAEFRGMAVPEVLVNGNHEEIRRWRRRRGRFSRLLLPRIVAQSRVAPFRADDLGFDHKIVRTADHDEMLDIIAPDDHQLAVAVEVEGVDDAEPRQPRPAVARRFQPSSESEAINEKDKRRCEQEGERPDDERQTLVFKNSVDQGLHRARLAGKLVGLGSLSDPSAPVADQ